MKNIRSGKLVNCIYKTKEEFCTDIDNAFGKKMLVDINSSDGKFNVKKCDPSGKEVDFDKICRKLSKYYGCKDISSVHFDNDNVWIAYKGNDNKVELIDKMYNKIYENINWNTSNANLYFMMEIQRVLEDAKYEVLKEELPPEEEIDLD